MKHKLKKLTGLLLYVSGTVTGLLGMGIYAEQIIKKREKNFTRSELYYQITNQWLKLKNSGIHLQEYFKTNGYKKIAIYGFSELGKRFCEELDQSKEVEILYIIDKNAENIDTDKEIYCPSREMPPVDCIVVMPAFAFCEIKNVLNNLVSCQIVSIEDVLYNC